jgi:hypothetical protein
MAGLIRSSLYFSSYNASASAIGNGKVRIDFNIKATAIADILGVTTIAVQKRTNNTWSTVTTFYSNETSCLTANNVREHEEHVIYYGMTGAEYRAVLNAYVKIGNNTDNASITTNFVTS